MSRRFTLPALLAGGIAILALAACGNSSTPSSSSRGSSSNSNSSSSSSSSSGSGGSFSASSCPSASTVGSALGATVGSPTTINETTNGDLPSGATGIGCTYISGSSVVVVVLASGVPSSYFSTEEQAQTQDLGSNSISFTPISGLGDQAASYNYSADGLTASGVMALKGSNVAGVFTDGVTTTVSAEETLVRNLL